MTFSWQKFVLEGFQGFNDCQKNVVVVTRALKLLSKSVDCYRSSSAAKSIVFVKNEDELAQSIEWKNRHPNRFFNTKFVHNVDALTLNHSFR